MLTTQLREVIHSHMTVGLALALLRNRLFWLAWGKLNLSKAMPLRKLCVAKIIHDWNTELVLRLSNGILMKVNPFTDQVIARRFLIDGNYERGLLWSLRHILKPGQIVVDVGANVGHISISAARLVGQYGRVLAIEPNPKTAAILRENVHLNSAGNITVLELAVARTQAEMKLFIPPTNLGGCRVVLSEEPSEIADVIRTSQRMTIISLDKDRLGEAVYAPFDAADVQFVNVRSAPLDSVLRDQAIASVDLMKIDVEGFELEVIGSAKSLLESDRPPIVIAEYSNLVKMKGGQPEDIFAYFKSIGWSVYALQGGKEGGGGFRLLGSESETPDHDNLYFVPPHKTALFD